MKRIVRLTESDLTRIVRRVIKEQAQAQPIKKEWEPIYLGHVDLPNSQRPAFYNDTKRSVKLSDGSKIIYGSTFNDAFKNYNGQLEIYCPGKKYPEGKTLMLGQEVTVFTPNWSRFCK
jgi:hypothetical protein